MQPVRRTAPIALAAVWILGSSVSIASEAASAEPRAAASTEPGATPPAKTTPKPAGAPVSLYFGDIDADGLDDALAIDPAGRVSLLLNRGEGRFDDFTVPSGLAALEGATCALLADFDGDGRVDLFVGSSEQRLWRNLGGASFEALESGLDHDLVDLGARAIDHDNDGRLDLALSTEAGDVLYRNARNGRFERVELPGADSLPTSVAAPTTDDADDVNGADSADPNLSPTRRRLRRWIRARNAAATAAATSNSLSAGPNSTSTSAGNLPLAGQPSLICAGTLVDQNTLQCVGASSNPTMGQLYPLTPEFNVTPWGHVGIGTPTPGAKLHVTSVNAGQFRVFDFAPGNGDQLIAELTGAPGSGPQMRLAGAGSGFVDIGQNSAGDFVVEGADAPRFTVTQGGNVGVGTTTPGSRLDVNADAAGHSARVMNVNSAGTSSIEFSNETGGFQSAIGFANPGYGAPWAGHSYLIANGSDFAMVTNNTERMRITAGGNVGIGTTTPGAGYHLDVNGQMKVGSTGSVEQGITMRSSNGNWQLGTNNDGNGSNNNQFYIWDAATLRYFLSVQRSSGRVGINTTTPSSRFEVYDDNTASVRVRGTSNANPSEIYFDKTAVGSQHRAAMGYRPAQGAFVWVNGADRLTIDTAGLVSVKQSLEIRGGADIVERFESSCGALEPGTVVSIDPEHPGKLACASGAYDKKVAGVVSGAGGVQPGLCLSQDGMLDGDTPVAMNGRVYVKCTASNGAIQPGDRLTTADLAGHAMKVSDEQRSIGAVIGKAMTSLESGEGLVLVLVNLQ